MIHAVTELIATHLEHEVHGVNALLQRVPVYSTPGVGSAADVPDEAPAVEAFYHEFADDWIAQDKEPKQYPSLTVFAAADADKDPASGDHDPRILKAGTVTVAVLYISRHARGATARREATYTLRAVTGSLVRLATKVSQANRTLRGVTLTDIWGLTEQRLARDVGPGSLAGMVLARCSVVDDLIL